MASPSELELGPNKRDDNLLQIPKPRRPRLMSRVSWAASEVWENNVEELNFPRVMYHIISGIYVCFMLFLVYWLLPIHGHWSFKNESDKVPTQDVDLTNYFSAFDGYSECGIRANKLYQPLGQDVSQIPHEAYCPRRKDLLEAMSSGGRIGFDAPYFPRGCHYRWFTPKEICMILERFQNVVFVGDDSLQAVYNGFNILLRRDLSHGAMKTWDMDTDTLRQCTCDQQFTSQTCSKHYVSSSDELLLATWTQINTPYLCARTPHNFLHITSSPAPAPIIDKFKSLVPSTKRSNYHPIPIIHALSPSTTAVETAISSLSEFLALADFSHQKTPMLWIGPTAAGYVEIRGRKGNQEIWDFGERVAQVAKDNDVEVLGIWNMSVQASSWDGVRFGEKMAITQAMMVINWLARLESS